jgi:hypothetical protein
MAWVARVILMHGKIGLWWGGGGICTSVCRADGKYALAPAGFAGPWEQVFGAPDFQINNNRPEVIQLLPWYIKQVQDLGLNVKRLHISLGLKIMSRLKITLGSTFYTMKDHFLRFYSFFTLKDHVFMIFP